MLRPENDFEIPEETAKVAKADFPLFCKMVAQNRFYWRSPANHLLFPKLSGS